MKIQKKFIKHVIGISSSSNKATFFHDEEATFCTRHLLELKKSTQVLLMHVEQCTPPGIAAWKDRKVYSIGCFDLFHRGHVNLLHSFREFGNYIIVGIHDDASYLALKNKMPIDDLERRMANVKPYVDQIFVIPHTEPTPYLKSMVSDRDVSNNACCYVRGEDMIQFPGREFVNTVMPVYFLPRSDGVSSTLVRTLYHSGKAMAMGAAFAGTDCNGKPIF